MGKLKLLTGQRTVTAAGTPERVVEGRSNYKVMCITIVPLAGNAGFVYVTGPNQVTAITTEGIPLAAGQPVTLDIHDFLDGFIDLNELWIDADNNGEGIFFFAWEAV